MNKALLLLTLAAVVAVVLSAAVPDENCSGAHERWTDCGSACPLHCPVRNARTGALEDGSERMCPAVCRQGCVCEHGFVRDGKRAGACVEKALCSPP
ncbi:hypothetical protein TYRP_023354 [Tyrophagus putrescentiae]|nr:hypothetical protein TYRP_023354 [Tyrophagus putrescentiae]